MISFCLGLKHRQEINSGCVDLKARKKIEQPESMAEVFRADLI